MLEKEVFEIPEELKKMIEEELNRTYSVSEALEEKKKEEEAKKKSFDIAWDGYYSIKAYRSSYINTLRLARIKANLLRLITVLLNQDATSAIDLINKRINISVDELKKIKKTLNEINTALSKLQISGVAACNYDICELLAYLGDKMEIDSNLLVEDLKCFTMSLKGIRYTNYANHDEDKLEEVDKKIAKKYTELGLSKLR